MQAAALLVAATQGIFGVYVAYHCVLIIMQADALLIAVAKGFLKCTLICIAPSS